MTKSTFGLVLVALTVAGSEAAAQAGPGTNRFGGNLSALVAQPVGDFDTYVDVGWGIGGNVRIGLDPAGVASLRFDLGFINYGRETQEVCLSATVGCRIVVDLTTTNNIAYGLAGLQLGVPTGPVRPYVNGGVGFSYFFTESSVEGTNNQEPFASTTNFDDGTFSWAAGGGIMIPISSGRTPISLDIGARYHRNNEVDYLTKGSIRDNPNGSIDLFPTRSEANLITYSIGVSIGFSPGR